VRRSTTVVDVLINGCFRYRQNELKDGAQRSVARQYWYINYTNFCNVVKWRVAEMRARIDKTLRNVIMLFLLGPSLC
jgi:transcription initiation factor TFIIE subunit alpha